MCPTTTHTYQTEKNDTKVSMLPKIGASPLYNLPCLHAVESKNPQLPTKKKTYFFAKTLKLFSVHTQNPKVRNLLHWFYN
jgi:hypothetical protein